MTYLRFILDDVHVYAWTAFFEHYVCKHCGIVAKSAARTVNNVNFPCTVERDVLYG